MNWLWAGMMLASVLCAALTGRLDDLLGAALSGAGNAVQLCFKLLAIYTLWCGILEIVEDSGLAARFAQLLSRPLMWLYPSVPAGSAAARYIGLNMAANMLGVGNAATPAGLQAMEELKNISGNERASDDMCMLLVVNCSSLQLLPTTVIALRQAAGAASPSDILLPALLSSVLATVLGVLAAKGMAALPRFRHGKEKPDRAPENLGKSAALDIDKIRHNKL